MPPAARVWILTGLLSGAAYVMYETLLAGLDSRSLLPWPLMAIAFAAAELKVVEVHFRRETHSFSLSEFPAVIGFFTLAPGDFIAAVVLGSGAALLLGSSQRFIKTAFNLANFMFIATVELSIITALHVPLGAASPAVPDVYTCLAIFLANGVASIIGAVTIALAITLSGGAPQFEKLPEMVRFGEMVAVANTSLALLAVVILRTQPELLWLLALPLVIVFIAYRAFLSEREKHERLEMLYQSSRILQHSPELDSSLVALLSHARTMFRAELAEVVLYPRDDGQPALRTTSTHDGAAEVMVPFADYHADPLHAAIATATRAFFLTGPRDPRLRDAMVSPLRGESDLIGSIVIANRLTEGTTFRPDDLPLLETLATQVAVALENGHLEQSLAELSRLKEALRHQAYHDPLTGLPNRSLFVEEVAARLATASSDRPPTVLFLDLDEFKMVNDTFGHAAGDQLLVDVAGRLGNVLRSDDVAARLGGDEFGILLEEGPDLKTAIGVGDRILDALRITFLVAGSEIHLGGSIGIAAARGSGDRADELLRNADVAMYTAKAGGKNRVSVFEPTMHAAIVARHQLSAELSRSLGRGDLVLLYQPVMDLRTGEPAGTEALVRWRHPERGLIGPDEFIPIAEETGTIVPLGRWVLTEACRQAATWSGPDHVGRPIAMTVNLSAQQLAQPDFVDDLVSILRDAGLAPAQLILEMTETVMFHDTAATIARLGALRELGVRIAIDDFGTGYSSLGYLRRFPVDILKIAREFIGQSERPEEWPFAAAIVALGHALGMSVIAEGIERGSQLAHLRELDCEYGQGYLFARPLERDAAEAFLVRRAVPPTTAVAPAHARGLAPGAARASRAAG